MTKLRQKARRDLGRIYRSLFPGRTEERMPAHALQPRHVGNARLLPDRTALLQLLPENGVVAELGVDQGKFSNDILTYSRPAKLHLVDMWGTDRYGEEKKQAVANQFAKEIEKGTVVMNIGMSTEVVDSFDDALFDWIYIDTDHTYRTTIKELLRYEKKVKRGGIIAGHDYVIGNWQDHVRYGVIEAVHQFCCERDWELIYLTSDLNMNPSFAIRRISDAIPRT